MALVLIREGGFFDLAGAGDFVLFGAATSEVDSTSTETAFLTWSVLAAGLGCIDNNTSGNVNQLS